MCPFSIYRNNVYIWIEPLQCTLFFVNVSFFQFSMIDNEVVLPNWLQNHFFDVIGLFVVVGKNLKWLKKDYYPFTICLMKAMHKYYFGTEEYSESYSLYETHRMYTTKRIDWPYQLCSNNYRLSFSGMFTLSLHSFVFILSITLPKNATYTMAFILITLNQSAHNMVENYLRKQLSMNRRLINYSHFS